MVVTHTPFSFCQSADQSLSPVVTAKTDPHPPLTSQGVVLVVTAIETMRGSSGGGKSSSSPKANGRPPKPHFPMNLVTSCRGPRRSTSSNDGGGEEGGGGSSQRVVNGISCGSTKENVRGGKLSTVASQEELERYAATQELLSLAQSPDEASQVSKLSHSDSMEALAALERSGTNTLSESGILSNGNGSNKDSTKRRSFRGFRKGPPKFFGKIGHALKGIEKTVFPHKPELGSASLRFNGGPTASVTPKVPGGVLLHGCTDDEEHYEVVRQSIAIMKKLHGMEGLRAMGLEYRKVELVEHCDDVRQRTISKSQVPPVMSSDGEESNTPVTNEGSLPSTEADKPCEPEAIMSRLFHKESDTMITMKNRKVFIADGDMYDQVARLCQEYAQEVMIEEGDLEWVNVCDAGNNPEPIRALVNTALVKNEDTLGTSPTLLISTGNGKVRAGIFSRQHLITTGMECSTAVPVVREAKKRGMNCVLLDPNVHGDRLGMVTFEKSMARVFRRLECDDRPPLPSSDLYVLSHSQSGAQFARYLLDRSSLYVPHIRAIAFTDSTHNIQWTRDKQDLHLLLQSDRSVYFKVSKESTNDTVLKPLKTTGMVVDTDHFWKHRFGSLVTRCAGTTEHSLTNWFARHHIWSHFDSFMDKESQESAIAS